jgi:hypothetical protein
MYGCSGQDDVVKEISPVASSNNSPNKMEFSTEINAKDLVDSGATGSGHASIEELPDGSFKVITEKHPIEQIRLLQERFLETDWSVRLGRVLLDCHKIKNSFFGVTISLGLSETARAMNIMALSATCVRVWWK